MVQTEALLITASITPKNIQNLVICNSQERLIQYLTSLIAWIKLTDIKTIIFCENTNTDYDFLKIKYLAEMEGKILEVIVFDGNQKAQRYGKGYGEGKIIQHAIENSQYLIDQVNFYKITGRLFLPEFSKFQKLHSNFSNVFRTSDSDDHFWVSLEHPWAIMDSEQPETILERFKQVGRDIYALFPSNRRPLKYTNLISTMFYKSNVSFFKKHLINSYKRVNEKRSYTMEHVFYEDLKQTQFCEFLDKYKFWGICAGTGESYSDQSYPKEILDLAISLSKI